MTICRLLAWDGFTQRWSVTLRPFQGGPSAAVTTSQHTQAKVPTRERRKIEREKEKKKRRGTHDMIRSFHSIQCDVPPDFSFGLLALHSVVNQFGGPDCVVHALVAPRYHNLHTREQSFRVKQCTFKVLLEDIEVRRQDGYARVDQCIDVLERVNFFLGRLQERRCLGLVHCLVPRKRVLVQGNARSEELPIHLIKFCDSREIVP